MASKIVVDSVEFVPITNSDSLIFSYLPRVNLLQMESDGLPFEVGLPPPKVVIDVSLQLPCN